jgi:hypothetical protein
VVPCLPPCFGETRKPSASSKSSMMVPSNDHVFLGNTLVAIFHIVVALTHNKYTEGCLPVGKTHKGNIWRVEFIIIMIIIFCEVHKIGWILAHRVCGFLNMQPPIEVKIN